MVLSYALYFFLLLQVFPKVPTTAATTAAYTATDFILLNCGESSSLYDNYSRSWNGDDISRYLVSKASNIHPSVHQVPYEMVSFSSYPFTYTFSVNQGPKFLRLYFHPGFYSDFDTSLSFFSVTANAYTLLSNFSAFLYSKNTSQHFFMKEFVINIEENQSLVITFSPNPNSVAFINGIEIVSIPDKLYFRGNEVPIKYVDQLFYLNSSSTTLENLYRLSVGGSMVEIQDDSGPTHSLFRAWSPDDDYIYGADFGYTPHAENLQIKYTTETPSYSAPERVYKTSRVMGNYSTSLDWLFPVDSGFHYLLRFHFCEFLLEVTKQNQMVFTISINNQINEIEADVIGWTGGSEIPIFRDYITWVPDDGRRRKKDLRLSLFPNMQGQPEYASALLNGLEIFKLSDSNRSLAAANPQPPIISSPPAAAAAVKNTSRGSSLIYALTGSLTGVLAVVAAASFLIFRRHRKVKNSATTSSSWVLLSNASRFRNRTGGRSDVSPQLDICRCFSLHEIQTATRKFDDNFVIGKGGFGNVYKGFLDDCAATTTVAIKRLNPLSNQGAREFRTEIKMLSKLRHLHLVSLIGYCDESGEMILVFDYMAHGTLRSHLYNSENSPLTWKQRLRVCIGVARGLHYLHTGTEHAIIHRDVKSSNILLDHKWVAKVSDFGLSKVGPTGGANTHVSTVVKGSLGYVDPEYCRRQRLTDKSDVYSFGVVLFEVLCGRPPIISSLPREQVNLAEWAKFCYNEGTVEQIVDSNLNGQIGPECLSKFAETAVACVGERGIERPTMGDIVGSLEVARQLQETAEARGCGSVAESDALSRSMPLDGEFEPSTTDEETFSSVADGDGDGSINASNVGLQLST